MIKQLGHINIRSTDLEKTRHFYCDVLGLEKNYEFIRNGELYGYFFGVGNMTFVEAFFQGKPYQDQEPRIKHLCFEVDDLEAAIASIREKGWPIGDRKLGADNAWQAWLEDPDGIVIELHQYTPDSCQMTGQPCNFD